MYDFSKGCEILIYLLSKKKIANFFPQRNTLMWLMSVVSGNLLIFFFFAGVRTYGLMENLTYVVACMDLAKEGKSGGGGEEEACLGLCWQGEEDVSSTRCLE